MPEEACYADDIGDYRWEGVPLAEKHGWMQTGAGPAAVQPAVAAMRELSARLDASDRTLRAKLAELGVTWSGAASSAAASATDRLAEWVGGVGRSTAAGQGNVDTYGSSFATMKSAIPPPVEGPGGALGQPLARALDGFAALVIAQTDYSRQAATQQAADQRANAALDAHRDATRHALQTFPVAEAPPDPTAGAAAAGPPGSAGPSGSASAGSADARAASPTVSPPDGRAGAHHPGPAHPSGPSHPSGPVHPPGTPLDPGAGTSSAAAGAGPAYIPPGGSAPSAPAGPIPVGPAVVGAGPAPAGAGPAAPWGHRPSTVGPGSGAAARAGAGAGPAAYGESAPQPRIGGAPGGGPNNPPAGGPNNPAAGGPGNPAAGGAQPRAGAAPGMHGAPMGMGAAPGGAERYHRNQTFIPSDEPFHVEFADISPPVLGVRREEEP